MSAYSNPNLLPVVSVSATQIMQHTNAFGGNAVSITYGVGNNGWTSVSGSEIEVWGQGYVDLLARRGSTGLKYTFSDTLEAGIYYLKWSARGRWPEDSTGSSAENEYNVQIADFSGIVNLGVFEANVIEPSESAENFGMFFELLEPRVISIAFIPTGAGTRGPLIGIVPILEKVEIEVVQTNYPEEVVGNSDKGTLYSERIIGNDEIAWITGTPDAAKLVAKLKCSSLKNWSFALSIRSERSERGTVDNRDEKFENLEDQDVDIPTECIGGNFTLTVTKLISQEDVSFLVFPKINFKVRGRNPMDEVVRSTIDTMMGATFPYAWAIALHETIASNTIYNQFNSRGENYIGKPNFGYPDGWGIAQIDYSASGSTASTEEVYNWKTNIASMQTILIEKRNTFLRIKERVLEYWAEQGTPIEFPDTYEFNGHIVSTEMLSVAVYYNGASGRNGSMSESMPTYNGSRFPWELVDGILVFVDNGNSYAESIVNILFFENVYVE